ncbi:hypothetical protein [Mycobacterium sp. PS03-16]|uniref:hypothetical protein n=1 Tax=Mycobacterium sp. PS03-16 TaxID=2559611 RepID=UPI0014319FC1|nr:hypothetical protein [Mycobacterium sp. PS03-16]
MKAMIQALRDEIAMVSEVASIAGALNSRRITAAEATDAITRLGNRGDASLAA